jgi:drug/metabolite transporter (DMT)-like permease
MTEHDTIARNRWLVLTLTRIAGSAGAILGVILIGRAQTIGPKILGVAIVLSALAMIATVPRSLARRWRTPPEA